MDSAKKKEYRSDRGSLDRILLLGQKAGLQNPELSTQLGYSKHAVAHWIKADKAPVVAGLAAEGLLRRLGKEGSLSERADRVFVIQTNGSDTEATLMLLKKLGVKFTEI